MDYLNHLSASGQLLLEKDSLHYISNLLFLKNKTEKKKV